MSRAPKPSSNRGTPGTASAPTGEGKLGASVEELQASLNALKAELDQERQDRNYFQLERDKVTSFWEISKQELENTRAELRNKDREMEELEEKHQVEIKVYKQKVKHLLFEHQTSIAQLKAEHDNALKLLQEEYRNREAELKKDKRALKLELKELELAHEDVIKNLKQEHDKKVSKLRAEHERMAKELLLKYEKKMKTLRDELELRRKIEIHEIEERKNTHINELMKKHEKAFGEIKNYYNDITHNNLDLIKSLKEEVANAKKKEATNEKLMFEIAQENKRLSEPLQRALKDNDSLKTQLANYEKDKLSLANSKARLKVLEEQLKNVTWEHEVLLQRFEQVQKERDELYDRFVSTIYDVQQKSGFRNLILEKKLETVQESLEKKEAQLSEVLAASNLDPQSLGAVTKKLDDVLEAKNNSIKDLQYELHRVTKETKDTHNNNATEKMNHTQSSQLNASSISEINMSDLVQQNLSRLTDTRHGLTRTLNYTDGAAPLWRTSDAKAQKSGKLHTVYWPDGDQFTGEWFDNKRDGYGIQKYKNGSKYEGEWKVGLRSGKGTFFSRVEGKLHKVYEGTWKDDKMEGLGTYFFPNGDIYEGEFKTGLRHGWGVHVNKAGDKYEGEWAADKKSGFGTLTMANQNRYEGKWFDDKKHGPGVFYYMSRGQRYDGEWVNDTPKCGSLSEMQTALTTNPAAPLPKLTLMNPEEILKSQTEQIRKTLA